MKESRHDELRGRHADMVLAREYNFNESMGAENSSRAAGQGTKRQKVSLQLELPSGL
jgi:hypothetical protein